MWGESKPKVMKRNRIIITMVIIATTITVSGQTPSDIARKWDEIQLLCEKYDDGADSAYRMLNEQLNATKKDPVANAIWHSCMGQFLNDYYNGNRYRLRERTQLANETPADFKEWDVHTFHRRAGEEYLLSLKDADRLQMVSAKECVALMPEKEKVYPHHTLLDILAHRYLVFLRQDLKRDENPDKTLLQNPDLWDNTKFLRMKLPLADNLPDISNILAVYQLLTQYHNQQGNATEMVQVTLERFDFMRERGLALDNSLTWYIDHLTRYGETCENKDAYSYIAYKLGTLYAERSKDYDAELHPEYRDDLVTAVSLLQAALQNTQAEYAESAKSLLEDITTPALKIQPEFSPFPTESSLLFDIDYKDVTKAYIRLIPISYSQLGQLRISISKQFPTILGMKSVYEEVVDLPAFNDHRSHSGHYSIPKQRAGGYLLLISSKPFSNANSKCTQIVYFQVSDIHMTSRHLGDKVDFLTVHQKTGRPLENATIKLKTVRSTKSVDRFTLTSDKNGFASLQLPYTHCNFRETTIEWNKQTLYVLDGQYWWYYQEEDKPQMECQILLDRMLYRPGQTVYFKGVVHQENKVKRETESMKLVPNQQVKVFLYDVNDQEVETVTLTTNDFGSFTGNFELPTTGLTGRYYINVKCPNQIIGAISFSVEEYKRPTFEVTLNKPKEMIKLGQSVTVEGVAEALSGYPIDGATVTYNVTRRTSFPWWRFVRWPSEDLRTILAGTTETDAKGAFTITFPTEEDLTLRSYSPLYLYEIEAVVTDITGETHSSTTTVQVSRRSLELHVSIPEELDVTSVENRFPVSLTNIAGVPQDGEVRYEIHRLQMPSQYYYPVSSSDAIITPISKLQDVFPNLAFQKENEMGLWKSDKIFDLLVSVSKDKENYVPVPVLDELESGYYKFVFKVQDPSGDWVEETKTVHLYRAQDTKCTGYKPLWYDFPFTFGVGGYKVEAGDTLQFSFGTYLKNARVLCEIAHNGSVVHSQWYNLRQNTMTIQWPTRPSDQGTLSIHLFLQSEGNTYEPSPQVSIVNHSQDIQFEFLRFRDKTLPGSQEELQVRLKDKDGKPVSAELLCTMYDYALDELGGRNFLNLKYDFTFRKLDLRLDEKYSTHDLLFSNNSYVRDSYNSPIYWTPFNNFSGFFCVGFGRFGYSRAMAKGEVVLNMVEDNIAISEEAALDEVEVAPASAFVNEDEVEAGLTSQSAAGDANAPAEQLRTNFNETAFFYPQLRTDANGEVYISFTMPDALTKWKMQGVAHNPDLQYGRFEKFVQTAKDLMIVPNAPRFLREGDTMDFSAKVVNTSDKHLCGYVTLEFFNAVNNQPVNMLVGDRDVSENVSTEGHTQYDVAPGTSQEVHFRIVVSEDVPAVTYRIIARNTDPAEVAGDGEEKILPVLTNRMMVTETMPFYISGKGSKSFTFNKLQDSFGATDGRGGARPASTTLKHYRLTVECTPNPVWYAIQAMPYMMEYPHDCNEQMFSRYYANALATHILKANPIIEEVFNRWQTESPEAFCSALEKNSELKQIVLEETPWVLDAQREGANKQALAAMFDFKRMSKEESATLKKLQQAQNGDGGWPWFPGGKSCDFITRHIVAGFGHLKALGVSTDVANSTLRNAVSYMDAQMYQRYLDRKKYHYTYVDETHYLYARSFYKDKISKQHQPAYDTCYKVLLSGWKSESFYTQAMIALTAWRNGDQKVAREIVKYLKSMAQHNEEMGMFWKKQGGGWFWYEQPVERQAMLIEAFHTITPEDEESLAQMQLWLLKQKQTQHWSTTKSTTEAIYALLLNKTLVAEDKTVAVTVGNVRLPDESTQTEAGTGYFKKAWTGEEITADKANVRIEKGTDGPAWGGLYWQYFENLDKITRSDDKNLIIEKKLYKVENTDKGEVLKAITANQPLQKGDKVRVRVVITADRDMEFVHLKDMRAATFEPVNVFSQYKYQDGLWYYEATKDAATHFFIDWMPKGKYVFEYTLFATQSGNFSNGITEIECMYAPEFRSHSAGIRVQVQ